VYLQRLNTVHMSSIITQCLQCLQDPHSVGGVCTVCVPDGILWSRRVPDGAVLTASHGQPRPHLTGGLVLQADAVCLASPVRGSLAARSDGPVQVAALRAQAVPRVTWSDRCEVSRQVCAGSRPSLRDGVRRAGKWRKSSLRVGCRLLVARRYPMPPYHVHMSYIKAGAHAGGAAGFRQYLSREGRDEASQFRRYLERDGDRGKDDLIAHGADNLPRWAWDNPERFWRAADAYERPGWVVARHLQVTLPRELSPEGRRALADDIREVTVGRFAHSWAIHEPMARDGSGVHPHVHILFSPRREDVELDRTPAQWFAKAAAHDQDPLRGGARKDPSWDTKGRLYDVRAAVALLTNVALEREGLSLAVDHRTLEAQGLSRDPARYGSSHDQADLDRTMTYRQQLRASGVLAYEQLATYAGWKDQAVQLLSLDRQYVKDLARDHVWRFDRSPARELERQQSMQRTLSLAMGDRQPTVPRTPERTPAQQYAHARQTLRDLAAALERLADGPVAGAALNVRLHDREREHDRGIGF